MKFYKTRDVKSPNRGTPESAGIDLFIPNDFETQDLEPGESILIPSGLKFDVPKGHALIAMNKSGIAVKKSLLVGACVIDEDYLGETHIDLKNVGEDVQTLTPGDKIIQLLCVPVDYVSLEEAETEEECFGDKLIASERGAGGFGSTGTK